MLSTWPFSYPYLGIERERYVRRKLKWEISFIVSIQFSNFVHSHSSLIFLFEERKSIAVCCTVCGLVGWSENHSRLSLLHSLIVVRYGIEGMRISFLSSNNSNENNARVSFEFSVRSIFSLFLGAKNFHRIFSSSFARLLCWAQIRRIRGNWENIREKTTSTACMYTPKTILNSIASHTK